MRLPSFPRRKEASSAAFRARKGLKPAGRLHRPAAMRKMTLPSTRGLALCVYVCTDGLATRATRNRHARGSNAAVIRKAGIAYVF